MPEICTICTVCGEDFVMYDDLWPSGEPFVCPGCFASQRRPLAVEFLLVYLKREIANAEFMADWAYGHQERSEFGYQKRRASDLRKEAKAVRYLLGRAEEILEEAREGLGGRRED